MSDMLRERYGFDKSNINLEPERLIQGLEGFYNYQTALTLPITYGPNRRIGAMGVYMVMAI